MRKEYWWLVLIIIIATYLRVANLTSVPPGLYPDEAMNGNNALEAFTTHDFKVFYPENNGREGLFINIQAMFLSVLGNEPWVLRLPSVIFGILTVLGMYFLTRELFADQLFPTGTGRPLAPIALLSAFLLAVSFWHINFSRIGFRAIMAPFFLTWGIYFLLKSLKPQSKIIYPIIGGLIYGLGFHSYIAYRATPLIILCIMAIFLIKARKEGKTRHFYVATFVFIAFTILATLPLSIYFLENPGDFLGRTGQISIFNSETPVKDFLINTLKTAGMFNVFGDMNWRHNIAGKPLLFWPVGILFIIGAIVGIRAVFRNSNSKTQTSNQVQNPKSKNNFLKFSHSDLTCNLSFGIWILFIWLIVAALPVVVSNEGLPHALRAILMVPPVIIISSLGGLWLFRCFEEKLSVNKLKAVALLILTLITVEAYTSYFVIWAKNPNTADAFSRDYVEIARELNALPKETPKFVVVNAYGVEVRGIPMPAQTIMFVTDTFRNEERIKKNIRYLTPDELMEIVFPENAFIRYLN